MGTASNSRCPKSLFLRAQVVCADECMAVGRGIGQKTPGENEKLDASQ